MQMNATQERRRELLLKALEACPEPEQALTLAVRMEQFIVNGQNSREKQNGAIQSAGQSSSEQPENSGTRSRWAGDDDALLRQLWRNNVTVEAIAQKLHRTSFSIYGRVRHLGLSSEGREKKNKIKKKTEGASFDKCAPHANSDDADDCETVIIDSVVHFLRSRDYSVVQMDNGRYKLDERKVVTAQELFERANKLRTRLGRPTWAMLENAPKLRPSKFFRD